MSTRSPRAPMRTSPVRRFAPAPSVARLLTVHGWENKLQGCTEFKNEAAPSSRTFAFRSSFRAAATPVRFLQRAVVRHVRPAGPNGGLPGFPVIDPASSTTSPAYFLPLFPGIDSLNNLTYGTGFPASGDPDEYLGSTPTPFPYPAIDPDPSAPAIRDRSNAGDTVLRTNALALSIAPAGQQVDLATGTPIAPNTFPTGQGSQNVIIGKSGGEANLFGNIPGKGYGIDVTVSLATKINSIFRIQDQDVFDTPLVAGSQYPAGIFNCRQIWSGVVPELHPGRPSDGQPAHLAGHHQGRQAAYRKGHGQHDAADSRRAVRVPDAVPFVRSGPGRAGVPDDHGRRWPGHDAGNPDAGPGSRRYPVARDTVRSACRTTATSCRSRTSVPLRPTLSRVTPLRRLSSVTAASMARLSRWLPLRHPTVTPPRPVVRRRRSPATSRSTP